MYADLMKRFVDRNMWRIHFWAICLILQLLRFQGDKCAIVEMFSNCAFLALLRNYESKIGSIRTPIYLIN